MSFSSSFSCVRNAGFILYFFIRHTECFFLATFVFVTIGCQPQLNFGVSTSNFLSLRESELSSVNGYRHCFLWLLTCFACVQTESTGRYSMMQMFSEWSEKVDVILLSFCTFFFFYNLTWARFKGSGSRFHVCGQFSSFFFFLSPGLHIQKPVAVVYILYIGEEPLLNGTSRQRQLPRSLLCPARL